MTQKVVVPSLASLVNRRYGIHPNIVQAHANTVQQAKYKLKMGNRLSSIEYSHCSQFPLYGTGQGSGNSPCIWLFLSATLFEAHEKHSHGATFISADNTIHQKLTMVGFVDDTTGTCNDFRAQTQSSISELGQMMQKDAQKWTDLLYTSGGSLELLKTSYQILHFKFKPSGAPQVATQTTETAIQIQDPHTSNTIRTTEIPAKLAHKTLGQHKSPADPKQSQQLQILMDKAKKLSLLISNSPVSRKGAVLAYNSIYIPAIKYPLPHSGSYICFLGMIGLTCGWPLMTSYKKPTRQQRLRNAEGS